MHSIQRQLLELAQTHDVRALGLREIGRLLNADEPVHPQKVKHHLQQLNLLETEKPDSAAENIGAFVSIPIYGLASCGPAVFCANWTTPMGHVQVSRKLLPAHSADIFAVKAVGSSLNRADIHGKNIEGGDYVIVDPVQKDFEAGDYVLSVIDGLANIKKFARVSGTNSIALLSESTANIPPIFIHEEDMGSYVAAAKVIDVLKTPKLEQEEDDFVLEKVH